MNKNAVGIKSIEYYLPPKTISTDELVSRFGFDKGFIEKKIGISQLYMAESETVSDMSVKALELLISKNPELRENIDLLVLCTQTPDFQLPQTSSQIQSRCKLPSSLAAFDISLGCSGFVYGLSVVEALMEKHEYNNAVLITAETYSKVIDDNDRNTKCLFSDAAAATLISRNGSLKSGKFKFGTDGDYFDRLIVKGSGTLPCEGDSHLFMDGRAIFNFTVSTIPSEVEAVCDLNNINKSEIDYFVLHQASRFVLESIGKKIGINESNKLVNYIHKFGNTVSSSIPIALKELLEQDNRSGLNILISGFGVGLSWATTILKINEDNNV